MRETQGGKGGSPLLIVTEARRGRPLGWPEDVLMINVLIKRDEKGRIRVIESKGHANYSYFLAKFFTRENTIVCAAVSALLQTIPLGLEGCLKAKVGQERERGYLKLTMPEGVYERSDLLLESIVLALKAIEKEYPSYLSISVSQDA